MIPAEVRTPEELRGKLLQWQRVHTQQLRVLVAQQRVDAQQQRVLVALQEPAVRLVPVVLLKLKTR